MAVHTLHENRDTQHLAAIGDAIERAQSWLREQHDDGYWVGMLESNPCMEAEWILAAHVLGVDDQALVGRLRQALLNRQRDDGSWEIYDEAPAGDINATLECYAALRASGLEPDTDALASARGWILDHGGLACTRVFTRYWLALIGEWPWEKTPNLPPEVIYLPRWFPFCIYNFSSWARATMVPLALVSSRRPVKPLRDGPLDELFPAGLRAMNYELPDKPGGWASLL